MFSKLRPVGNSYGVTLEKQLLRQLGYVQDDALTGEYLVRQVYQRDSRDVLLDMPQPEPVGTAEARAAAADS